MRAKREQFNHIYFTVVDPDNPTDTDYYNSMVIASIIAGVALLGLVIVSGFYIKRACYTYRVIISEGDPKRKKASFHNRAFKVRLHFVQKILSNHNIKLLETKSCSKILSNRMMMWFPGKIKTKITLSFFRPLQLPFKWVLVNPQQKWMEVNSIETETAKDNPFKKPLKILQRKFIQSCHCFLGSWNQSYIVLTTSCENKLSWIITHIFGY